MSKTSRKRSRRRNARKSTGPTSRTRRLIVEPLEPRAMLAITGVVTGNTVSFTGDALPETASLTVDGSGFLAINGSTDLNNDSSLNDLLAAEITGLTYNDTGTNDTLLFEGSNAFNFSNAPAISIGETNAIRTLVVDQNLSISDAGTFTAEAVRNIEMNPGSSLATVDGNVTLSANLGATPAAGDFSGINLNDADISTTDGDILLQGRGGDDAATALHHGVVIDSGSQVTSTGVAPGAGTISVNGTGGAGTTDNRGVYVVGANTRISSVDGDVSINGVGGDGTSHSNQGVRVQFGAIVSSTGTTADAADIDIVGVGGGVGGGTFSNYGYVSELAGVSSKAGDIAITGTSGPGNDQDSIFIAFNSSVVGLESTEGGDITLTGTNATLVVENVVGSSLPTATGGITMNTDSLDLRNGSVVQGSGPLNIRPLTAGTSIGLGGGAGTLNLSSSEFARIEDGFSSINIGDATSGGVSIDGVSFNDPAAISGSSIAVSGINQGSGDVTLTASRNIFMNSGSKVATADGDITLTANQGATPASGNFVGVNIVNAALEITGTGMITVQGTGGDSGSSNYGVSVVNNSRLTGVAGGIAIVGIGGVNSGGDNIGVLVTNSSAVVTSGGGNIDVLGAGIVTGIKATGIDAGTGLVTLTAPVGIIREAEAGADVTASSVRIDGEVAPAATGATERLVIDGSVVFESDDSYTVELNGVAAGTGHDQLQVTGAARTVAIDGATLNVSLGFTPAVGDEFVIVENTDSGSTVAGTFAGLDEGDQFTVGGTLLRITYQGGTGNNDVVLVAADPDGVQAALAGSQLLVDITGDGTTGIITVLPNAIQFNDTQMSTFGFSTFDTLIVRGDVGEQILVVTGTNTLTVGTFDVEQDVEKTSLLTDVTTTGGQEYESEVDLKSDVRLTAKDGQGAHQEVIFSQPVSGDQNLIVDGKLITKEAANVSVQSLDVKGSAKLASDISATGNTVEFHGKVELTKDVTITDTGTTGVIFHKTVDSDALAFRNLVIDGKLEAREAIGNTKKLGSLQVKERAKLQADVSTVGEQHYVKGFDASGTIVISAVDDAGLIFDKVKIDGTSKGDGLTFKSRLQTTADLEGQSILVEKEAILGGNVKGTGNTVEFRDKVELTKDVTITDTGTTGIIFNKTVDSDVLGPKKLVIDGRLEAREAIGSTKKLSSFQVKERAMLQADVSTVGEQHYVKGFDATGTIVISAVDDAGLIFDKVKIDGPSKGDGLTFRSKLHTAADLEGQSILVEKEATLGGNVKGTGNTVEFRDKVELTKDVTITDTGTTGVIFNKTVDSDALAFRNLVIDGKLEARQAIGSTKKLGSLQVKERAKLQADVSTVGEQHYKKGFDASGTIVISAVDDAGLIFDKVKIDGPSKGDGLTFRSKLQTAADLEGQSILVEKEATLGGNVKGTGNTVEFREKVELTKDVTITDTGTTGVIFNKTVDSDALAFRNLVIEGKLEARQAIGSTKKLGSLQITERAKLQADVSTVGEQHYVKGFDASGTIVISAVDDAGLVFDRVKIDGVSKGDGLTFKSKLQTKADLEGQSILVEKEAILGGNVKGTGNTVEFRDKVELTKDVTITDTGTTGVIFNKSVDSDALAFRNLVIEGKLEARQAIGSTKKLGSLQVKERAKLRADVSTVGEQHYVKGFDASGTIVISAVDDAGLIFDKVMIDGSSKGDGLTFRSKLQTAADLEGQSILVEKEATLGGNVKGTGNSVEFKDKVELTKDVTITDTGTTGVIFNKTVDSDTAAFWKLVIDGKLEARQAIGSTKKLGSLQVKERAKLRADVSTVGEQHYVKGFDASGTIVISAVDDAGLIFDKVKIDGSSKGDGLTFRSKLHTAADLEGQSILVEKEATLGGNVKGTGNTVEFKGKVELTKDVTITDKGTTGVIFNETVDSDAAGSKKLVIDGKLEAREAIGGTKKLSSLQITERAMLKGDVSTIGEQHYEKGFDAFGTLVISAVDDAGLIFDKVKIDGASKGEGLTFRSKLQTAADLEGQSILVEKEATLGGNVKGTGNTVEFRDKVELTKDVTITDKGTTGVIFNKTVDSDAASPKKLVIDGKLEAREAIGGAKKLSSLQITERAMLKGDVSTIGEQHYEKGFDAFGTLVISAVDDAGLIFNKVKIDGASKGEGLTFRSKLQTAADLEGQSILVEKEAILGGNVKGTGNTVEFKGKVELTKDVTITDKGTSGVIFNMTVDSDAASPKKLVIDGKLEAREAIGKTKRLASLVITERAVLQADVVTAGQQHYQKGFDASGPVELKAVDEAGLVFDKVKIDGTAPSTGDVLTFDSKFDGTADLQAESIVFKQRAKLQADVSTKKDQRYEQGFDALGQVVIKAVDETGKLNTVTIDKTSTGEVLRFEANVETNDDLEARSIRVQGESTLGGKVKGTGNTLIFDGAVKLTAPVTITDTGTTGVIFHKTVSSDPLGPLHTLNLAGTAPVLFTEAVSNLTGLVQQSGVGEVTFLSDVNLGTEGATFEGDVSMTNLTFDSEGPVMFDNGTSSFDDTTIVAEEVAFGDSSTIAVVLEQPDDVELQIEGSAQFENPTLDVTLEFELSPTDTPTFIDASDGTEGEFDNIDDGVLTTTGSDGNPVIVNLSFEDGEASVAPATRGKAIGGGIIDHGARAFGFVGIGKQRHGDLRFFGNVRYRDREANMRLRSTSLTYIRLEADGIRASIQGTAKLNGESGYTFHVRAEDHGWRGRGNDVFRIEIFGPDGFRYDSDDFSADGGVLDWGNIYVRKPRHGRLVAHDAGEESAAADDEAYLYSSWQMLIGVHTVAIVDDANLFGIDGRMRISSAISTLNDTFGNYGVTLTEVDSTEAASADIRITAAPVSVAGGAADGVLGVATHDGLITIVTGWDWYTGADTSTITPGQYDLQTIVTHELGHVIGLEHSPDVNSVMNRSLADALARRTLTAQDLSGLEDHDDDDDVDALRAAGFALTDVSQEEVAEVAELWMSSFHHNRHERTELEPFDVRNSAWELAGLNSGTGPHGPAQRPAKEFRPARVSQPSELALAVFDQQFGREDRMTDVAFDDALTEIPEALFAAGVPDFGWLRDLARD